jgi:AraC family transcriptional regulator of adaptative response/methylated-DNA-[protein]-cysteine methyltransferase
MNSSREVLYHVTDTPFGRALIACTPQGLAALHFIDAAAPPDTKQVASILTGRFPLAAQLTRVDDSNPAMPQFQTIRSALMAGRDCSSVALDFEGTPFQRAVWEYLRTIPCGETQSYLEVARAIGKPRAYRAVANACAQNQIAMAVPCHRVIQSDGSLGGYRWGISRKEMILSFERTAASAHNGRLPSVARPKKLVIETKVG